MQALIMLGFGAVLTTILVWFSNLLFRNSRSQYIRAHRPGSR